MPLMRPISVFWRLLEPLGVEVDSRFVMVPYDQSGWKIPEQILPTEKKDSAMASFYAEFLTKVSP